VRRTPWPTVRALALLAIYLVCEAIGIVAAGALWVAFKLVPGFTRQRYLRANFRLQCWWATALFRAIEVVFGIETRVTGGDRITPGPILVFSRHASTGDTLLPAVFVSGRHDIVLRWVLKRELLWDPCLDIVGNRLRNYFVDRQSTDPTGEIEAVASLATDLDQSEGVLIYPEGTRFTAAKRARALERLRAGADSDLLGLASSMRNVLPPKLGGPIALLQENPRTDLVLLAHVGFEDVESLATVFNGSLVGRTIRVHFQRIARRDIPDDPRDLRTWIFEIWKQLDEWIENNQPRSARAV
jgi:1-acyl-sn-glycerol-3-phosphate acyltransferase